MAAIGDRIALTIDSLRQHGITIEQRTHGGDPVYSLATATYHLHVTVNPSRWVGLHLGLGPADHKPTLTYDIDTDLYDLAHPRFQKLALAVEEDVVAFLQSLADGRVRVGKIGRQPALLIPVGKRTVVVTRGRFARSTRVRRAAASVESKGAFVALI